jgi:hypothetical protein
MKYLLLLHVDESGYGAMTPEERTARTAEYFAYNDELEKAGALVDTARLSPSAQGKSLTTKGGRQVVTDGPYAETKEVVGGFYLIDAKDMDEALAWAARCPTSGHGVVEVRQLFVMNPVPA